MIYIVRNADRGIKTFMEKGDDYMPLPGETMEALPVSLAQYVGRFRLSAGGRAGELLRVGRGSPPLTVDVSVPLTQAVELMVNDVVALVELTDGAGTLVLGTDEPGLFLIQPRDRTTYCAAGEALLAVEVTE